MNKAELQKILDDEGVPRSAYDLNGERDTEQLVRSHTPGAERSWAVYYSERGIQSGKREFAAEGDACAYMLGELLSWDFVGRFCRPSGADSPGT